MRGYDETIETETMKHHILCSALAIVQDTGDVHMYHDNAQEQVGYDAPAAKMNSEWFTYHTAPFQL